MLAIAVNQQSCISITHPEKPQITSGEALIKTLGCGICGTDLLKINLRLLQKTTVLGHEIVGEIVALENSDCGFAMGDRIVVAHHVPCFECHFCKHENFSMCKTFKKTNLEPGGFSQFVKLSAAHLKHTAFKLPADMDWRDAIFTEPLACCVRNLDRLNLRSGDTVVVVGLGSIGLMMTALLKDRGCKVLGLDLVDERLKMAFSFGLTAGAQRINLDQLRLMTENRMADALVFTAGPASLLNQSLQWVRDGGSINLFSHLAGESTDINVAELYHRELQIVTTYSPSPDSLNKSFELIRTRNFDFKRMLTHFKPQDFSSAVDQLNQKTIYKALVEFNDQEC